MRCKRRDGRNHRHDLMIISPNSNLKSRVSFLALVVVAILVLLAPDLTESVTHLRLNKASGSIEPVHDSAFTLQRPFDLVSLLAQIERVYRLDKIKRLMATQQATDNLESYTPTPMSSYQEAFYHTDSDCVRAGRELNKFSFFETYLNRWHAQGLSLPKELLLIKPKSIQSFEKPFCNETKLPFTMETYDHFECIQKKETIQMKPDSNLSDNMVVESEDHFGHLIHLALSSNSTSWVYMTMASEYFRLTGDFSNAITCLQRAIYYSPSIHKNVPRLYLSNMLHKLEYINESLSIMLTNIAENMDNSLFAYYLGNVYSCL